MKKTTLKTTLALAALAATSAIAQNKAYSGAELYSNEEWLYGKYEARMYMGAISGTVSSMFLYNNGSEIADGRPWVEIDIEILGKNPGSFQSNIITGKAGAQNTSEKHHTVSPAANASFHTYGIEWTPDYVRWTLDGKEVRKATKGSQIVNGQDQVAALNKPQGIRFNLWSHEDAGWVGAWDDSKLPVFQFINWVKRYKYTPGQGPDGSDFTLDWTDNFDTFDSQRWSKGDWSFDGNRVDLTKNNIYSKEGMLILALTKKGQEMFNGQVPVDNEPAPVSSSSQPQPASSSSQQNPWQPLSSSSQVVPPASSSSEVYNPWNPQPVSSSSQQVVVPPVDGIQKPMGQQNLQVKRRGTFNAKGERVNKANASRYRVDFEL
ncbi:MAG: family 16 glycosylhydrolase [Fibrobacter sp.]|nr:family 16 glycosylhydrolase [Fibrobacter sp.]